MVLHPVPITKIAAKIKTKELQHLSRKLKRKIDAYCLIEIDRKIVYKELF